jgi:hypothetical protein
VGTHHRRDESIYIDGRSAWAPITGEKRVYIPGVGTTHRREERTYIHGAGTNRRREDSIYLQLEWAPIHRREESIYPEWEQA